MSTTSLPQAPTEFKATLSFSLNDGVGVLLKALQVILDHGCNLSSIKSQPAPVNGTAKAYDFTVDCNVTSHDHVDQIIEKLLKAGGAKRAELIELVPVSAVTVPWFPQCMADLDTFASKVLSFGNELDADHPGFKDEDYRKRRGIITENALKYRTGQPLPDVDYTEDEKKTWTLVFDNLIQLYPTHACREYKRILPVLLSEGIYSRDDIPQIGPLSKFLKGFTLRPVMGLLSPRDFLNGLALRVFHSTQYIRHPSRPYYTPEPDVVHELLGHVPLLADPDFADFSHELGLASLGVSDAAITQLSTIYWFTVEFGLCREDNAVRAYGAGLLSSADELQYALTSQPRTVPFDPARAASQSYPITTFQPLYFVAESFTRAKEQVRAFADQMHRPYALRYNAGTDTIEVLDAKDKLVRFAHSIKGSVQTLLTALEKLDQAAG